MLASFRLRSFTLNKLTRQTSHAKLLLLSFDNFDHKETFNETFISVVSYKCILIASFVGDTLYLNTKESLKRSQTADTIRSNAASQEEYSMFPYENNALTEKTPRQTQTRDHKSRENTWKHSSSDEDG